MVLDSRTQQRVAQVAAEWAAEVAPRVRAIAPDPKGTGLEKFAHHLRDRDVAQQLTVLFYLVVEETTCQTIPWRSRGTELEEGEPGYIGHLIKWLISDTQTVAAPFPLQRQAIPERFVCLADEIALEFNERLELFLPDSGSLHGLLMERQLAALMRLDEWFGSFSGQENEELWTEEALKTAPQWRRARDLAREALSLFAIELR